METHTDRPESAEKISLNMEPFNNQVLGLYSVTPSLYHLLSRFIVTFVTLYSFITFYRHFCHLLFRPTITLSNFYHLFIIEPPFAVLIF